MRPIEQNALGKNRFPSPLQAQITVRQSPQTKPQRNPDSPPTAQPHPFPGPLPPCGSTLPAPRRRQSSPPHRVRSSAQPSPAYRSGPDAHTRLLGIVREWLEHSGPDLSKIDRQAYAGILVRSGSGLRMVLVPHVPGDGTRDVVSHYFIQLLLNPERERLGAPCPNCGNWYIKKTLRKSVFCSRPCADKKKLTTKRAKVINGSWNGSR
jgi:hypothetical protein